MVVGDVGSDVVIVVGVSDAVVVVSGDGVVVVVDVVGAAVGVSGSVVVVVVVGRSHTDI